MALIKCPECGKEISDKAASCPNCGCPLELKQINDVKEEKENNTDEDKFFTVCNKCARFDFTKKIRIDNTIKSQGYPTCMWCGSEIKILAGKQLWMKKSKLERENIVQQELQRVKNNSKYDASLAMKYGNVLRPDLDVQGFCPQCASEYTKATALNKGIKNCEFCGAEIRYSDMLASDFSDLWEKEREKQGISVLKTREPLERFVMKTFLLDDDNFNEVLFNKKWHPEQYKQELNQKPIENNTPKCSTCGSTNIRKISGTKRWISTGLFGLASSNVGKTMECKNCGYKW